MLAEGMGSKCPGEGNNTASLWRATNATTCCSPSARNTEQVQYSKRPPGASSGHSAASSRAWVAARAAMSDSRRSQRTSGWRRTIPEAVEQFNRAVADYNRAIAQFPAMLLAWVFDFKPGRPL